MDERITNLKQKIVKTEDFFRDIARTFRDKAGLKYIHFLMPDAKMCDFITVFSTYGSNIRITKKDLASFNRPLEKDIFYPRKVLWGWDVWKQICYFKVIWKIYLYGISAIMPVKGSNGVCCLIIFCDQHANKCFDKNTEFAHTINQHISFCLESIRLYNQTLEGIIRQHDPLYQKSAHAQIQRHDEQIPTLIERKVEFL